MGRFVAGKRRWWAAGGVVLVVVVVAVGVWRRSSGDSIDDDMVVADGPGVPTAEAREGFAVELASLPLIVESRLRVVAEGHRLTAQPLAAPADAPAHWSYARRSTPLLAVDLAPGPQGRGPVVVTEWGDLVVVGIDASTGERLWWRTLDGDPIEGVDEFGGVERDDLGDDGVLLVGEGGDIAVVSAGQAATAIDVATGDRLWRREDIACVNELGNTNLSAWAVGEHLVIDNSCHVGPAVLVLDALTGDTTDGMDPPSIEGPSGLAVEAELEGVGCTAAYENCTLVAFAESRLDGGRGRRRPQLYTVEDGRLVARSQVEAAGLVVETDGESIDAIKRADGRSEWTLEASAPDGNSPQFADADIVDDEVWVASRSWAGGPGALVRLAAEDGSLTGCLSVAGGFDQVQAHEAGWVVAIKGDSTRTEQVTVQLVVPELQPTCDD